MAILRTNKNDTTTEAVNGTIQAVDVPVGVAARAADRVRPYVEPLADPKTRDAQIQKLRGQLTSELKHAEVRGAKIRAEVVEQLKPLRGRVEQEVRKAQQTAKERFSALV